MKKYLLLGGLVGVLILSLGMYLGFGTEKAKAGLMSEEVVYKSATATTTLTYITTSTATTTIIAPIYESKGADFNFCATASSSAATLVTQRFFSSDMGSSVPTWHEEVSETVSGTNITETPSLMHSLSLATTTTNYRCYNVGIESTRAKSLRIDYRVIGANTGIWTSVVAQKEQ